MRKALVVDDEADARLYVRTLLEADGWEVAEAADGPAGLAAARAAQPDLIVLDVQMPGMNGFQVFSELSADAATAKAKVVMLTGVREKTGIGFTSEDMGGFLGTEPAAYLEKPVTPVAFRRTLARVVTAN